MTRRRHEHDTWHDWKVAAAAIATLAGIWLLSELTDYDPPTPAPVPPQTVESERRDDALSGQASRGLPRPTIPLRVGRGNPDASGRPEDAGKRTRPIVGQTLQCIREAESGGDYRAESPTSSASGAWQFIDSTWLATTGLAPPASAYSRRVQDAAAVELWADGSGAHHWVTAAGCGA